MPDSSDHSEVARPEDEAGRRGDDVSPLREGEDRDPHPEEMDLPAMQRFVQQLMVERRAGRAELAETIRQLEMARAGGSVGGPSAVMNPAVVSVDEANAVVHARDLAAAQEINARDAEISRVRMLAESEQRRVEVESQKAMLQLRMQAEQAQLQMEQSKLQAEAAVNALRAGEAAAQVRIDREQTQSHIMQRALQEQQGQVASEIGRVNVEHQALYSENQRLREEMVALRNQAPAAGIFASAPNLAAQPTSDQMLLSLVQSIDRLARKGNGSSTAKLTKFDSTKIKEEAASLWIERLENVGNDDGWFTTECDLLTKIAPLLDDKSYQFVRTLPLKDRSSLAWPAFKAKWGQRFGLSRDASVFKLSARRQEEDEDARSFGESMRQLCLSANQDCNSPFVHSLLIGGFHVPITKQLKMEAFASGLDKSFEDILARAVEIEKLEIQYYGSLGDYRPPDLTKKPTSKAHDTQVKKGGGTAAIISQLPDPVPAVVVPTSSSGGKGYQGKGSNGNWTGGGRSGGGNGNWRNDQQSQQQASASGPTGAQGAVPMDIGVVFQQPQGRASTISTGWSFPEIPEVRQTQQVGPGSIWDHLQISCQGTVFMEALSDEHKSKLSEHLHRHPGYVPKKTLPMGAPQVSPAGKDMNKGTVPVSHKPFQKAAGANVPTGSSIPQGTATSPKPELPKSTLPVGQSKPPLAELSKTLPLGVSHKASTVEAVLPSVNYSQVGVWEMAAEYSLVQCRAIHKEKSYDCTLDTGSCLNLIHWKMVKDFGLTEQLVNSSISYKVADGHIAHTMGELHNVELGFGDCSFKITFSVVDRLDHTILLGTSFMHQAQVDFAFHNKEPLFKLTDDSGHQSVIPITYHRSHQWIRDMEEATGGIGLQRS